MKLEEKVSWFVLIRSSDPTHSAKWFWTLEAASLEAKDGSLIYEVKTARKYEAIPHPGVKLVDVTNW